MIGARVKLTTAGGGSHDDGYGESNDSNPSINLSFAPRVLLLADLEALNAARAALNALVSTPSDANKQAFHGALCKMPLLGDAAKANASGNKKQDRMVSLYANQEGAENDWLPFPFWNPHSGESGDKGKTGEKSRTQPSNETHWIDLAPSVCGPYPLYACPAIGLHPPVDAVS